MHKEKLTNVNPPPRITTEPFILRLFSTIYTIIFQTLKSTFADLLECGEKEIGRKEKTPYPGNINFQRKFRFSYSDGFPGKIRWFSYPSNKKNTEKTSLPPLSG